jgi:hypothetical protein
VQEAVVSARLTDSPGQVAEHRVPRTQTLIAMLNAASVAHLASTEANAGNLEIASSRLEEAQKQLRADATRTKNKAAKKKLEQQADRLGRVERDLRRAKGMAPAKRTESSRKAALELNDAAMEAEGY